jgi:hypothetical protein
MFGLFKKPDSKKTTTECLQVWDMLSERDRASCAKNMLIISNTLAKTSTSTSAALLELGGIKQGVIRQFGLRDHVHPAYMQVQILSDYIFSKSVDNGTHAFARQALEKMLAPLNTTEKAEAFKNLEKFL